MAAKFKKGDRVQVVSGRCPGYEGVKLIILWVTSGGINGAYACRPVYESGWDGKPKFFFVNELELSVAEET